jgi:hypothetical protein
MSLLAVLGNKLLLVGLFSLAVFTVDEVSAGLRFGGLGVNSVTLHDGDVASAPVDDEGLSDQEQHDGDLSDGEEAPDGGLFHEVIRDQRSQDGAEQEQEQSLEDHSLLLVEGKEWSKHQERVDTSSHDVVTGVGHWDGPAKVGHGLALESAKVLTSQPFSGWGVLDIHGVQLRNERQEITREQQKSTNQTQSLDDSVAVLVFATLGQRGIDHVAVVWLQTDVQESQQSQDLVGSSVAWRRQIRTIHQLRSNEVVLNSLQKLHREEEENSTG